VLPHEEEEDIIACAKRGLPKWFYGNIITGLFVTHILSKPSTEEKGWKQSSDRATSCLCVDATMA